MRRKMMLVVLMLGLLGVIAPVHHAAVTTAESRPVARYHEPTLLIHGYRAGPHAFDAFIRRAELTRRGRLILTAFIGQEGISYRGRWRPGVQHPLIRVVFTDNHRSWQANAQGLNTLLRQLKARYGVQSFNAVAHSRGNMDLLTAYGEQHPLVLRRAVLVAVPANGKIRIDDPLGQNRLLANGQPLYQHPQYRDLVRLRATFPWHTTRVLSVMGNIGNGSDGVLTNVSSQSLAPALGRRFASFKQVVVTGRDVDHHWLIRRNPRVINLAMQFLWPHTRASGPRTIT